MEFLPGESRFFQAWQDKKNVLKASTIWRSKTKPPKNEKFCRGQARHSSRPDPDIPWQVAPQQSLPPFYWAIEFYPIHFKHTTKSLPIFFLPCHASENLTTGFFCPQILRRSQKVKMKIVNLKMQEKRRKMNKNLHFSFVNLTFSIIRFRFATFLIHHHFRQPTLTLGWRKCSWQHFSSNRKTGGNCPLKEREFVDCSCSRQLTNCFVFLGMFYNHE